MPPLRKSDSPNRPAYRPGSPARRKSQSPLPYLLIIIPLAGIAGLIAYQKFRPRPVESEESAPVVQEDPNQAIDKLLKRLEQLHADFKKVMILDVETPKFKIQSASLDQNLQSWMADFEKIFGPHRVNGRLRGDFAGYSQYAARASTLRDDLIRRMGM